MPLSIRSGARVLAPGRDRRARRRIPAVLGGALLLFALGLVVGRLSAPGQGERGAEPPASSLSPTSRPPSPPIGAMRPHAAQTREGAARSAARALSSLADPNLVSSRRARRVAVSAFAPPAYRADLDPLFDRTYEYLSGILGASAAQGEVVLRMTPLGYRVEAFSPRRATVAIWQVTLLATPERAPIAAWSTSRAELAWSSGRWRVERFGTDTPGPAPSVTAPAAAAAADDFVSAAQDFSPFVP